MSREITGNRIGDNAKIHQGDVHHVHHHGPPHLAARPAVNAIPYPRNEEIVRRTDIVDKLDVLLPKSGEFQSAALWGLGGSGKTQLALDYAYRRCRDSTCSVFWVHADNEATFRQDYKTIARKLRLRGTLDGEKLFTAVRDRIESLPQWLLVLDNVDDLSLFGVGQTSRRSKVLVDYIPKGPRGTVLWTSRDERIVGTLVGSGRGLRVANMTIKEADRLLKVTRNKKTSRKEAEAAKSLFQELQWLPLAISQAGAYMRRTSTPINDYLAMLNERKKRWSVLKESEVDRHRRQDASNSILETWSISIERIRQESETAYHILHTIAYLDNQNIPLQLMIASASFPEGLRQEDSHEIEQQVEKAILRLKEFSFIGTRDTEDEERSFEMHKLVQEAARYTLKRRRLLAKKPIWAKLKLRGVVKRTEKKDDDVYFSNVALQVITDLFPESEPETWKQCEKYLTHAIQVSDWSEICGKEIVASNLLSLVSDYLHDRGNWMEKETVDKRVANIRKKILGGQHPDTIWAIGNLASTYHKQGRFEEAEEIKLKVLELQREILGKKHPDTILAIGNLASTYHKQGQYKEAGEIDLKVLEL